MDLGERAVEYGLGSVRFWNRVRARGPNLLFFIFFGMVRTIPSKKEKKVTHAIPAARADPKSKTILFFFARSWCMPWGLVNALRFATIQVALYWCSTSPHLGVCEPQKIGCARAGEFFFSRDDDHTMPRKKKVATGKSGARADPNQH